MLNLAFAFDAGFEESKHPRDEGGKFSLSRNKAEEAKLSETAARYGRPAGDPHEDVYFNIRRGAKNAGYVIGTRNRARPSHLKIDMVASNEPGALAINALGPKAIRQLLEELRKEFPGLKTVGGKRISGGREAAGKKRLAAKVKLPPVKAFDEWGFMRAAATPLTKTNVREYIGRDVPGWQRLGLKPGKPYRIYCPPGELKKAAARFNGLPIINKHGPLETADVIGWTGSRAEYAHPYVRNRITLWAQDAIADVQAGRRKELSAGYDYDFHLTPGRTPAGEAYDGVMTNIRPVHVALVKHGRAGRDVAIAYDEIEERPMSKLCYEGPYPLAMDEAAAPASRHLRTPLDRAYWAGLQAIARDGSPDEVAAYAKAFHKPEEQETDMPYDPNDQDADDDERPARYNDEDNEVGHDGSPAARLHGILAEHCPPEVMQQIGQILSDIAGEAEEGEEEIAGEDEDPDADEGGKDYQTARYRNARLAQDAKAGFLSTWGMRAPAIRLVPRKTAAKFAMDARASADSYLKMFPSAARIGRV